MVTLRGTNFLTMWNLLDFGSSSVFSNEQINEEQIPCSESLAIGCLGPLLCSLGCELRVCDAKESKPGNILPGPSPLSRVLLV